MIRSFNKREKMSYALSPRADCSTTIGTRELPYTSTGSRSRTVITLGLKATIVQPMRARGATLEYQQRKRLARAWSHGSTNRSQHPRPHLHSCDADGDRAYQLQHPVPDMNGNVNFGGPMPILARAHPPSRAHWSPVADHLLLSPDRGLDPAALVVARCRLPPDPALLDNALEMAIALGWFGRRCPAGYCRRAAAR
jgi:hypothetical protein